MNKFIIWIESFIGVIIFMVLKVIFMKFNFFFDFVYIGFI